MDLSQTPCVKVPVVSCHRDHVVNLDQSQSLLRSSYLPYLRVYMGCALAFVFAGPLPLRSLKNGLLFRVHFGESLVVRLYSEIDHLHLSIEAECVSHLLPTSVNLVSLEQCHPDSMGMYGDGALKCWNAALREGMRLTRPLVPI